MWSFFCLVFDWFTAAFRLHSSQSAIKRRRLDPESDIPAPLHCILWDVMEMQPWVVETLGESVSPEQAINALITAGVKGTVYSYEKNEIVPLSVYSALDVLECELTTVRMKFGLKESLPKAPEELKDHAQMTSQERDTGGIGNENIMIPRTMRQLMRPVQYGKQDIQDALRILAQGAPPCQDIYSLVQDVGIELLDDRSLALAWLFANLEEPWLGSLPGALKVFVAQTAETAAHVRRLLSALSQPAF